MEGLGMGGPDMGGLIWYGACNGGPGIVRNVPNPALTSVRSQSSREINNATKSEFSTFLKFNKPRIQFLLRLTRFYPIDG